MATGEALGMSEQDVERYIGVVDDAQKTLQTALEDADFEAFSAALEDLWMRAVARDEQQVAIPMLVVSRLQALSETYRELGFVLEHDAFPALEVECRRQAIDRCRAHAAEAEGLSCMALASIAPGLRNFTLARDQCRNAAQRFREASMLGGGAELAVFVAYAEATQFMLEGHSHLSQGNPSAASSAYLRARAKLEALSADGIDAALTETPNHTRLLALKLSVPVEAVDADLAYEDAAFQDRLRNGDARSARRHAQRTVEIVEAAIDQRVGESVAGGAFQRYLAMRRAAGAASCDLADAIERKNDGRCQDAREAFERAREHYLDAAARASELGSEQAVSGDQYVVLATVVIDAELRQLEAEEDLRREIEALKRDRQELLDALNSAAGTTIYNQADARAAVDNTVTITNQVEVSIRHILPELADQLRAGPDDLVALADSADALTRSDERGLSFIERAKKLTRDLADVMKNVGETAATVYPAAKLLGLLVGVPLP